MRAKKTVLLITAVCIALMSTGCWDATDINEKALITLVLTDRQDGEFVFYVEVPNLAVGQSNENGSGDAKEQYSIVTGAGESYAEARRRLNSKMDNPVFLGSTRALVITDELAMHGMEEYMYRMQNMLDYRKTLHVVTTAARPEDFIAVKPENNVSLGNSVDDTITWHKDDGKFVLYTVSDILDFLYSRYCFVLPNMDVHEGKFAYNGYTIIHNGRYLGFIPLEDSKGLVWLLGDNIKLHYVVNIDGLSVTAEVTASKRDIKPVYSDGRVSFDISFNFHSKVLYLSSNIKFNEQVETRVKNALKEQLLEDITSAVSRSQSYHCDYMGFKERFRVSYPNIVSKLDWESEYTNAVFHISVDTTIETGGIMDLEASGHKLE